MCVCECMCVHERDVHVCVCEAYVERPLPGAQCVCAGKVSGLQWRVPNSSKCPAWLQWATSLTQGPPYSACKCIPTPAAEEGRVETQEDQCA